MKQPIPFLLIAICAFAAGCSSDSAQKIRYDMEKLVFAAGKISERINVQPELATASDSAALKSAYLGILDFYFQHRTDPALAQDETARKEMGHMAVGAKAQLARIFAAAGQADSVIASYRSIGSAIPAGREDMAGATLALALTYRSLNQPDSVVAIYDRLLADYYPPVDSLNRVNSDLLAIPIDKIRIGQALGDSAKVKEFVRQALAYYDRLKTSYPNTPIARTCAAYSGRTYAMAEQWDQAVRELQQVTDSTGQIAIEAALLVANIYDGPKREPAQATRLYRQILTRATDSTMIGTTMLRLGASLCQQKQYEDGRQVLADLKKKFERYPQLVAKAQTLYAGAFEAQGRWDRALSEYQWLMENHPYTEEAFQTARHIPEYFTSIKDQKLADIWYGRAIDFYEGVIRNKQGQPEALGACSYLADTYRQAGRWKEAIESLDRLYALTPQSKTGAQALYNAAKVAYVGLKDSALAQSYFDRLRQAFGTTDSSQIHQEEKPNLNSESID